MGNIITGLVNDDYEPYDHEKHKCHDNSFSLKDSFIECEKCGYPVVYSDK